MKTGTYYNENDPFAAAWLRELIKAGLITAGDVDERSIEDIKPDDLKNYTRCHFFAGIGGWEYALQLAGWPGDLPVWTGSCPCQPFSAAGKGTGFIDERHLWPAWFHLIEQCRPVTIFGEQVEAAIKHGWLDLVQDDLERIGYAVGTVGLPAASVGAPHIRQRLWFVADNDSSRRGPRGTGEAGDGKDAAWIESTGLCVAGGMVNPPGEQMGFSGQPRQPRIADMWIEHEWIECADGKKRPTKSGIFPVATGVPNRVGALRGAGNSIVPQVAAEIIKAWIINGTR